MSEETIIIREAGKIKAKITSDKYGTELFTMRNGNQWVGQGITPALAELILEVVSEYLRKDQGHS